MEAEVQWNCSVIKVYYSSMSPQEVAFPTLYSWKFWIKTWFKIRTKISAFTKVLHSTFNFLSCKIQHLQPKCVSNFDKNTISRDMCRNVQGRTCSTFHLYILSLKLSLTEWTILVHRTMHPKHHKEGWPRDHGCRCTTE